MKIQSILGVEVLDSRGFPTVDVTVHLENGVKANAMVPSGASTGTHEAVEKRDRIKTRYLGKGVETVVDSINTVINASLKGLDVRDQRNLDKILLKLDGTENKSHLGANALLGTSLACAKAAALAHNLELFQWIGGIQAHYLPRPMMNIINGGAHANNDLDIQEFMIVPIAARTIQEALQVGSEVFHSLKILLQEQGLSTAVGDEGGFSPALNTAESALDLIMLSIERAGHEGKVALALDVASSELFDTKTKTYSLSASATKLSSYEMVDYFKNLSRIYPIVSIEDGLSEDDWEGWSVLTKQLGDDMFIVGDDLFVTNPKRLQKGIDEKSANTILIKPNQIGTLTETLDVINLAKNHGLKTIISHRSGETEDTTIADIAIATNLGKIKTGSLSRSERIAKYNRLLKLSATHPHLEIAPWH